MERKEVKINMDIVGNLDKDDYRDRFKIMQNKDAFNYYLFNCLIFLFSEHVNGFFDSCVLCSIIKSSTNIFSCNEEAQSVSGCIIMSLDTFGFIEIKVINDKDNYIKSTINTEEYNYYCEQAKKFCKGFEIVLSGCLDIFKDWIVYSENKKGGLTNDT